MATLWHIDWNCWKEQLEPAFAQARDTASLAPLEPWVPAEHLDARRHILTGKRFLLFGPTERKLIQVGTLLRAAFEHHALDRFEQASHIPMLVEKLFAKGQNASLASSLQAAMAPDTGLPEWMQTGTGPSLLSPEQCQALAAQLDAAADDAAAAGTELSKSLGAYLNTPSACCVSGSGTRT